MTSPRLRNALLCLLLGLAPMSSVYAQDTFTGGDDVDIEGRTPDGGGIPAVAQGTWTRRPTHSAAVSGADSSDGRFSIISGAVHHTFDPSFDDAEWDHYVIEDIVNLTGDYSSEVTVQFHDNQATNVSSGFFVEIHARNTGGDGYGLRFYPAILFGTGSYQTSRLQLIRRTGPRVSPSNTGFTQYALTNISGNTAWDTDYTVRLCVGTTEDGVHLSGYVNGVSLIEYDDDGSIKPIPTGGEPGFGMEDDENTEDGLGMDVSKFVVAAADDGNPGGGGGTSGTEGLLWTERNGAWRDVMAPGTETDAVQAYKTGGPRPARAGWVMKNGAWRLLPESNPDITGDPGDGVPDVGCIDVTTVAPPGPVDPLGTRLFYEAMLPDALYGNGTLTPFNATTEPMGDFILNRLAAAASTGMIIIGTQGGYTKFQTAGNYDPDKMDDFIDGHAGISAALEAYFIAGQFYGVSIADDFESSSLWPPSGLSVTELKRIAARWKSVLSWGLRVSIRGRPTQFSGENFSGYIDNCRAQYTSRHGDPETWRDNEVAACASINVGSILWSLNWTKGGPSGGAMSAAQIVAVGTALTDPATEALGIANHGGGGWRYDTATYGSQLSAYVTYRNLLAAL